MAHFETAMDVGQEFWTIELKRGERQTVKHEVQEIRIYGADDIGYVYDILYDECYAQFFKEDIGKKIFLSESGAKLALDLIDAAEE